MHPSHSTMIIKAAILIFLVKIVTPFECPEYCECTTTQGIQLYNHAKCTSLEGFNLEERSLPIQSLDLSHANLTRVTNHLEKLRNLVSLDLSHNQLSEMGRLGKRIKSLNLSYNSITSGKLSRLPIHVEQLDLSHNEITYLPLELRKLRSLRNIELAGNTINCTCDTLDVRNWLQQNHVWTNRHIKCTYPVEVKGQPWLRVRQSIICPHDSRNNPRSVALQQNNGDDYNNDLMMLADLPAITNNSEEKDNMEELEPDFMPVRRNRRQNDIEKPSEPDDGSGMIEESSDIYATINETPAPVDHTEKPELHNETQQESGSGQNPISHDNSETNEHDGTTVTSTEETEDTDKSTTDHGSGLGLNHLTDALDDYDDQNEKESDEQGRLMSTEEGYGSGSGSGALIYSDVSLPIDHSVEVENTEKYEEELGPITSPIETTTQSEIGDIFGTGLGIIQFDAPTPKAETDTTETTDENSEKNVVVEEVVRHRGLVHTNAVPNKEGTDDIPAVVLDSAAEPATQLPDHPEVEMTTPATIIDKANIVASQNDQNGPGAEKADSKNAYILLGIILMILVVLIVFVAIKRRSKSNSNRRFPDTEAPKLTELLDMDKKNPGKPVTKNGNTEHIPLIINREKVDVEKPMNGEKKITPKSNDEKDNIIHEPLLKRVDEKPELKNENPALNTPKTNLESNNNIPAEVTLMPNSGVTPNKQDQSPELPIKKETPSNAYSYPPPKSKKPPPSNSDDEVFLPSSPKTSRYSPVYSPETGRVKIKLSETVKPRTPVLVNRGPLAYGDKASNTANQNEAIRATPTIITTTADIDNEPSQSQT